MKITLLGARALGALGMMAVSALGLLWPGGRIGRIKVSRGGVAVYGFDPAAYFGESAAAKDRTASAAVGDPDQPKLPR